jgi:hypothetical protein
MPPTTCSPYKAKSLSGAQSKVRRQQKLITEMHELLEQFDRERKLLALLAAKGPAFSNPLVAMAAEKIRDGILFKMNMNPDGSYRNLNTTQGTNT